MFCIVKTRSLSVYVSTDIKKKRSIEEGADGLRHRTCMSCFHSIDEKLVDPPYHAAQEIGSGVSLRPDTNGVTVDMRDSGGQLELSVK